MTDPSHLVRRARTAAGRLMVDVCELRRVDRDAPPITNPDGTVTRPSTIVYTGRCRVQSSRPWPSTPDAGEHSWTLIPLEVHVPITVDARTDDVVKVTSSFDPLNVGRVFRVTSGDRKTFQSALRLRVEEISG